MKVSKRTSLVRPESWPHSFPKYIQVCHFSAVRVVLWKSKKVNTKICGDAWALRHMVRIPAAWGRSRRSCDGLVPCYTPAEIPVKPTTLWLLYFLLCLCIHAHLVDASRYGTVYNCFCILEDFLIIYSGLLRFFHHSAHGCTMIWFIGGHVDVQSVMYKQCCNENCYADIFITHCQYMHRICFLSVGLLGHRAPAYSGGKKCHSCSWRKLVYASKCGRIFFPCIY